MMVNGVTYSSRNTIREMGKVFGFADDVLDLFTSHYDGGDYRETLVLIFESDSSFRAGLRTITSLRAASIASILAARTERPFGSIADFIRSTVINPRERQTLSSSGALKMLAGSRRQAFWEIAKTDLEFYLSAQAASEDISSTLLTPKPILGRIKADYATFGLTIGDHPMKHLRLRFPNLWRADDLALGQDVSRVSIGGSVICRRRTGTANGFVFLSLDAESGVANAILTPDLFERLRHVITLNPALIGDGKLQHNDGVIYVKAESIRALRCADLPVQASHDFSLPTTRPTCDREFHVVSNLVVTTREAAEIIFQKIP